jgi:protein-S-isoprenylcysteine O-methyltransferase Ste14
MLTTLLGYLVVGVFVATEGRARQGQEARRLERGAFDQRSTALIGLAIGGNALNLLAALVLNYFEVAVLPNALVIGFAGVVMAIAGVLLRLWANRTLGQFYTRTLLVSEKQPIVQAGPYRVIRHPGYLGSILVWTGAAIATANAITIVIAAVAMFAVYAYRIQAEEQMLLAERGEAYGAYRTRTWRLIPFLY